MHIVRRLSALGFCCVLLCGTWSTRSASVRAAESFPNGGECHSLLLVPEQIATCYLPRDARIAARQLPVLTIDPVPVVTPAIHLPLLQVVVQRMYQVVATRDGMATQAIVVQVEWLFARPPKPNDLNKLFLVGEEFVETPPKTPALMATQAGLRLYITIPHPPHLLIALGTNYAGPSLLYQVAERFTEQAAGH